MRIKYLIGILFFAINFAVKADSFPMEGNISSAMQKQAKEISYGASPSMRMDIYGLDKGLKNAPVILAVHGGAWKWGDKANISVVENKMPYFVDKGYIFVSMNYDLVPKVDILTQASEVLKAVSYLQLHAEHFGIDPEMINVIGHSSGAHISALAATSKDLQARVQLIKPIKSLVLLDSAAYDVIKIMESEKRFSFYDAAFGNDTSYWRNTSPIFKLTPGLPPMLLVCSKFRTDSCLQALEFHKRNLDLGNQSVFYPINLNHGEINSMIGYQESYTRDIHGFIGQYTGK